MASEWRNTADSNVAINASDAEWMIAEQRGSSTNSLRRRKAMIAASSVAVSIVEHGSPPVLRSSSIQRSHHLATVLGLIPGPLLSATSEACGHSDKLGSNGQHPVLMVAALTTCVVVAHMAKLAQCSPQVQRKHHNSKPGRDTLIRRLWSPHPPNCTIDPCDLCVLSVEICNILKKLING